MGWYDNMLNQSFAGLYGNAARERAWLKDPNNPYAEEIAANDNDWAGRYDDQLRAQQGQAIAGGLVTGLTGATTLLSNAYKDAQIRDTSMQERAIDDLRRAGNINYNNYDQLANDYAQTNFNPGFNYQDIRGMTTGQQVGSVATSALSGAATGLQIGGLWGGLAGLVIGGATGLGGVMSGNAAAHAKQDFLALQSDLAADSAHRNYSAAHERIGDNIHRQNAVNAVRNGGEIRRQSIQQFADRVLNKGMSIQREKASSGVQRIMKNGGCVYRVKVK